MVARHRVLHKSAPSPRDHGLMSRALRSSFAALQGGNGEADHDEIHIDFGAAGLYLVGLQTTVATVIVSLVSIASCFLLPRAAVSAVRTLAVTALCGAFAMRRPLRFGRVRGVLTMFNALRPCVAIYILVLVVEQLVHTCVPPGDEQRGGGWRHAVFHAMTLVQLVSGLVRAYRPRSETDLPFLLTVGALLVIGLLPPASTTPNGPLCGRPTVFAAGERVLRALLFASVYVIHTYCAAPRRDALKDLTVCVVRCAAAALWILGCHPLLLCLAVVQAVLALWARFGAEEMAAVDGRYAYRAVDDASDLGGDDLEAGGLNGGGHGLAFDEHEETLATLGGVVHMPPPATETDGLAMGAGAYSGFGGLVKAGAAAGAPALEEDARSDARSETRRSRDEEPAVSVALIGRGGGFRSLAPVEPDGEEARGVDGARSPDVDAGEAPASAVAPVPPPEPGSTAVPIDPRDLAALTHTPSLRPEPRGASRPAALSFALSMSSAEGNGAGASAGGSQTSEECKL